MFDNYIDTGVTAAKSLKGGDYATDSDGSETDVTQTGWMTNIIGTHDLESDFMAAARDGFNVDLELFYFVSDSNSSYRHSESIKIRDIASDEDLAVLAQIVSGADEPVRPD